MYVKILHVVGEWLFIIQSTVVSVCDFYNNSGGLLLTVLMWSFVCVVFVQLHWCRLSNYWCTLVTAVVVFNYILLLLFTLQPAVSSSDILLLVMDCHSATMCTTVMVALWNRADDYIFALSFVLSSFLLSSPNLSRRRLDVCHTSTHGVALVRI